MIKQRREMYWRMERKDHKFTNLLGILLAFGIAIGGLLGVQNRLAQEEQDLLQGGGAVKVLVQSDAVEAQISVEAERVKLSEAELVQAVGNLRNKVEMYPHEPWQGQLSMAQAIEYGKGWMENFFMPHFGMSEDGLQEYKANCYLWSSQEGRMEGEGHSEQNSYWTVVLGGRGIEAELILHGVSGQVLEASVSCLLSAESWKGENAGMFLLAYADSFGFEETSFQFEGGNGVPESNVRTMYQSIGSEGIFAAMTAKLIMISRAETDGSSSDDMEVFNLQLYLDDINRD